MSTTATKEHAHELIDRLPSAQLAAIVGLLEAMLDPVAPATLTAPIEEEEITPETAADLDRARASIERGEGIPHEEIRREFRNHAPPMSEAKKSIIQALEAQAQIRAIDRATALDILHAVDDYLTLGKGDVKKLRPPRDELRLRVGDYRVFFYRVAPSSIMIIGVKHRSQAYR